MKIYLTADQHFGHKKIIKYENRPFTSVEEMDEEMIKRWNLVVNPEDTVIHLGDFALSKATRIREIIEQLNGHKRIILGNHDRSVKWYKDNGFEEAQKEPFVVKKPWASSKFGLSYDTYILTHEPIDDKIFNCMAPRTNIHGHLHSKKIDNRNYINVGVEQYAYAPVGLDELWVGSDNLKYMEYYFNIYLKDKEEIEYYEKQWEK